MLELVGSEEDGYVEFEGDSVILEGTKWLAKTEVKICG